MRWADEITLITQEAPPERVDENGFLNPLVETAVTVYGNKKSVGYSEFYRAAQAGYQTELKVDVYTEEYTGQPIAEVEGQRYKVLRTYTSKNGEITELTLSNLSQDKG